MKTYCFYLQALNSISRPQTWHARGPRGQNSRAISGWLPVSLQASPGVAVWGDILLTTERSPPGRSSSGLGSASPGEATQAAPVLAPRQAPREGQEASLTWKRSVRVATDGWDTLSSALCSSSPETCSGASSAAGKPQAHSGGPVCLAGGPLGWRGLGAVSGGTAWGSVAPL